MHPKTEVESNPRLVKGYTLQHVQNVDRAF